jgi:PKD repeat protein
MSTPGSGGPSVRSARRRRWLRPSLIAIVSAIILFAGYAVAQSGRAQGWLFKPDRTPPGITLLTPGADARTREPLTPLSFECVDPYVWWSWTSSLDLTTLSLTINGQDFTAKAKVVRLGLDAYFPWLPPRAVRVTYTPTAAEPLPEGETVYTLAIADKAGNPASFSSKLLVDTQGPVVESSTPRAGEVITNVSVPLTYVVRDSGAAVETASLVVKINGVTRTDGFQLTEQLLKVTAPPEGWPQGTLTVLVSVADVLGNPTSAEFSYTVAPRMELAAYPRAVPAQGKAPLEVTFIPEVTTSTAIERYEWDFTGDGTFDRTETVGRNQDWTYTAPGVYDAVLRVTDSQGKTATGTARVVVDNQPPQVSAEASPSNGAPPLAVTFSATATDSDGIAQYEWDFEGDGQYDTTGISNTATFTYATEGVFRPAVRVTDRLGASTRLSVPSIEVRVTQGAPTVTASASPSTGNAPLVVGFSATASDPDGQAITQWAWDFDGDGTYDMTSPGSPATTHRYTAPGTYFARVQATAADGGVGVDVVKVTVNLTLSLRVSLDTIDTGQGGATAIETTLGGDTQVSLVLESRAGSVIKTLVPWGVRLAGSYSDPWDGRDDQGAFAAEGEYRAILLYKLDDVVQRYDLGLTTGGVESNPPRSPIPPQFSPFAGQPLSITYTLSRASEVTAFMGFYNTNTRLLTFYQRVPQGRGAHTIVWNGENSDGQLMHPPPGEAFLFGIFAYTLPDNALFVRSGVHASEFTAGPPIFDPTGLAEDGTAARGQLQFSLNRAGNVELTVHDAETGAEISRKQIPGLQQGPQTLTWDGRDSEGLLVAPGRYRMGVTGIDGSGARGMTIYTLQRVFY